MNKKLPLGIVLALLCAAILLTGILTGLSVKKTYNAMLAGLPAQAARYDILDELESILRANYYGSSDEKAMQEAVAKGYVEGLPDGYSRYLSADEYRRYQDEASGEMRGIGIEFSRNSRSQIRVDSVMDASPAKNAGLSEGDVIVAIDAIRVDASNVREMEQKLEAEKISSVDLTFRRGKTEQTVTVPMGFEAQSVQTGSDKEIGYLKLTEFYTTTPAQVKAALDTFSQSGMQGVVLDLRNNKSENVAQAMQTLDVFVPLSETPASQLVDHQGNPIETFRTDAAETGLPLMVLVSSGTQAAAELFSADLRDFGKAMLVGTKTRGIGLVRKAFHLSNGDAVLLSVGEMLPYRSGSFNNVGLEPDLSKELEEVTETLTADSQFLAAASLLRGE